MNMAGHSWWDGVHIERLQHPSNPNRDFAFTIELSLSAAAQAVVRGNLRFTLPATTAWHFDEAPGSDIRNTWLVAASPPFSADQPLDGMIVGGTWRALALANPGANDRRFAFPEEL